MSTSAAGLQIVSFEGDIVEIREEAGQRFAKVVLTAPVLIDLAGEQMVDLHLGDHVRVRGWIVGISGHKEDA